MAEDNQHEEQLIHGYDFVDYDILWNAITINMPQLLAELERILSSKA